MTDFQKFRIEPSVVQHLEALKSWFPERESLRAWGGPHFRHPYTDETFLEDMRWGGMPACSALDDGNELLAFGQYYGKSGYCHLARLAVRPGQRSVGVGGWFISRLMEHGQQALGADACSLFVYSHNSRAVACYRGLGFVRREWPAEQEYLPGVIFMSNDER